MPPKGEVSQQWALDCSNVRMRRQLSHESLCRTAESDSAQDADARPNLKVQAWQDSFSSSAARTCAPCSAVTLSALEAALHWFPEDRASAGAIRAILSKNGTANALAISPPTPKESPVELQAPEGPSTPTLGDVRSTIAATPSAESRREAPKVELRLLAPLPEKSMA